MRQILAFNRPAQLETSLYNYNMYEINNVLEELLENILFAQSKVLETNWTINTLNNTNFLNYGIDSLNNELNLIHFYNELYLKLEADIINSHKEIYQLRREFIVNDRI